jgi:hypothetical protein
MPHFCRRRFTTPDMCKPFSMFVTVWCAKGARRGQSFVYWKSLFGFVPRGEIEDRMGMVLVMHGLMRSGITTVVVGLGEVRSVVWVVVSGFWMVRFLARIVVIGGF